MERRKDIEKRALREVKPPEPAPREGPREPAKAGKESGADEEQV